MTVEEVILILKDNANPHNVEGMARFGINSTNTFGISIPFLRTLAKKIGKSHELALELWESGYREARILASFIDEPKKVTEAQMEAWVKDFDSWDVCDQVCSNLFESTSFAYAKVKEWSTRDEEFVKRAAFALIAAIAVHDKKATNEELAAFFPLIIAQSGDERNYVRKAVNWALRQLGKRNPILMDQAAAIAEKLASQKEKAPRWIGKDALREFAKKIGSL